LGVDHLMRVEDDSRPRVTSLGFGLTIVAGSVFSFAGKGDGAQPG